MRRRPLGLIALLALAAVAAPSPARAERVKDDDANNFVLKVPDSWAWGDVSPFAAHKVLVLGERRLEVLRDGTTKGTGQGARVMLSVQDAPASLPADYSAWLYDWQVLEAQAAKMDPVTEEVGKKIDDLRAKLDEALLALAGAPGVPDLLMSRWAKDPATWPPTQKAAGERIGGVPAAKLSVEAPSANLGGNDAPCKARMFVWVLRKKMYRLALWAWPTQGDREQLGADVDEIELTFEHAKNAEAEPKRARTDAPADADPAAAPVAQDGDAGERKVVKDLAYGFEVVKPVKFRAKEIDRSSKDDRNTAFSFSAQTGSADAIVDCIAYSLENAVETQAYLKELYPRFVRGHPKGALESWPFPTYTEKAGFLVLPDVAKKKEVKRPASEKDFDASLSDLERMGVAGEVKGVKIGGVKVKETWRWMMKGLLERTGEDVQISFTFTSSERRFFLRVTARAGGLERFKPEVAEILKSFRLLDSK